MSDVNSSGIVLPNPAVSSTSGNAAAYQDNKWGGKGKGKKGRTAKKRVSKKKSKRTTGRRACWWRFF